MQIPQELDSRIKLIMEDPAKKEALLSQMLIERAYAAVQAELVVEAQQRAEQQRIENERRGIALAQSRFDVQPVGLAAYVDFYRNVLGWQLVPLRMLDGHLAPVGDGCKKPGQHILDDERGDGDITIKLGRGDLLGLNVPASRLCVLQVERDAGAEYESIRAHFHLPATLAWTGPDGVTSYPYNAGRVADWTDRMELGDGVALVTNGWSVLPPSSEWAVTPRQYYASLNGTATKGLPDLSIEAVTLVRDLRRATPETCKRYIRLMIENVTEAGTKGKAARK